MKPKAFSIFLILLAATMWASSGVFVHQIFTHSDLTPFHLAFLREIITCLILLGFTYLREKRFPRIEKKDFLWLAVMGAFGIGLFHVLWNYSVMLNGIAIGTMLQYNEIILVSVAAVFLFGEKMNWRTVLAIFGSLIGTALISGIIGLDLTRITISGLMIGLGCAVLHGAFQLLTKQLTGSYSPLTILAISFIFGTLVLVPFQLFAPLPTYMEPTAIASIFALIAGASLIAFSAYATALRHIPVSTATIIATSEVLLAGLFGRLFLHEQLSGWQYLGGALIVAGIVIVSLPQSRTAGRT